MLQSLWFNDIVIFISIMSVTSGVSLIFRSPDSIPRVHSLTLSSLFPSSKNPAPYDGKHGRRADRAGQGGRLGAGVVTESLHPDLRTVGRKKARLDLVWAFVTPSDTSPPTRPHLLIIFKQFHHLESKPSNI